MSAERNVSDTSDKCELRINIWHWDQHFGQHVWFICCFPPTSACDIKLLIDFFFQWGLEKMIWTSQKFDIILMDSVTGHLKSLKALGHWLEQSSCRALNNEKFSIHDLVSERTPTQMKLKPFCTLLWTIFAAFWIVKGTKDYKTQAKLKKKEPGLKAYWHLTWHFINTPFSEKLHLWNMTKETITRNQKKPWWFRKKQWPFWN